MLVDGLATLKSLIGVNKYVNICNSDQDEMVTENAMGEEFFFLAN